MVLLPAQRSEKDVVIRNVIQLILLYFVVLTSSLPLTEVL